VPKLWLVGKVALEELSSLPKIFHNMMQVEEDMVHPKQLYDHEIGKTLIIDETANIIIKNKLDATWTLTPKKKTNEI
jgi:hypothetical protein